MKRYEDKLLIHGGKKNTITECHLLFCHAIRFGVNYKIACPLKRSGWCVCVCVCVCVYVCGM